MSQKVDAKRIDQFRKDRNLLPYDDIVVAEKMGKDKSSYSKSVNEGPITNDFLKKFYTAFGDDLRGIKMLENPVEKEGADKRLAKLEEQVSLLVQNYGSIVDQIGKLTQCNSMLVSQMHHIAKTMTPLIIDNSAKVDEMLAALDSRKGE